VIEGVAVRELRKNADDRGFLMEVLRSDWGDVFRKFGQAYVSKNYPGVIRAWHFHNRQWDLFVCVAGMIKVVLYDGREGSPTRTRVDEFVVGDDRPLAILIPPGVLHGYQTLGVEPALLLNFPTELYEGRSDELRLPHDAPEIGYSWEVKHR
jgi:dTDP-4-dehydrorhamnose 3,5-epimerase